LLSVINVAGKTVTRARNNNKRRANVNNWQREHDKHRSCHRFAILFSFPIVRSCRRLPMLNLDDLGELSVCFVVGEAFKLDSIVDCLGS